MTIAKMKNKRAMLMPETLKIILAVISIGILIYLVVSFYGMFVSTASKQAEDSLEIIYSAIEKIEKGEKEVEVLLKSPNDWWVLAWEEGEKPVQCKGDYCVCICSCPIDLGTGCPSTKEFLKKCDGEKNGYCKDVFVNIKVEGKGHLRYSDFISIDSLTSLKIYNEENKIIIKEIEK